MKTMYPSQSDQLQELDLLFNRQIGHASLSSEWQNRVTEQLQQVPAAPAKSRINRNVLFLFAGLLVLNSGLLYYGIKSQNTGLAARENQLQLLSKELFINPN